MAIAIMRKGKNMSKKHDWYVSEMKRRGYKGCRNCKYQIDVFRSCEWLEHGGDGIIHLFCPRWERREDDRT